MIEIKKKIIWQNKTNTKKRKGCESKNNMNKANTTGSWIDK